MVICMAIKGKCRGSLPKQFLQYFCYMPLIRAEGLQFNHILIICFKFHCAAVQKHIYKSVSLCINLRH